MSIKQNDLFTVLRKRICVTGIALWAAAAPTASFAAGTPEDRAACIPDVVRFCSPTSITSSPA